mmetsp:Transcript_12068/g.44785  ORF Transcript_12068/g.44785 Transcript_12068/m.44785 type:complete len:217 (-) Transcript_12068:1347-1997(-)
MDDEGRTKRETIACRQRTQHPPQTWQRRHEASSMSILRYVIQLGNYPTENGAFPSPKIPPTDRTKTPSASLESRELRGSSKSRQHESRYLPRVVVCHYAVASFVLLSFIPSYFCAEAAAEDPPQQPKSAVAKTKMRKETRASNARMRATTAIRKASSAVSWASSASSSASRLLIRAFRASIVLWSVSSWVWKLPSMVTTCASSSAMLSPCALVATS